MPYKLGSLEFAFEFTDADGEKTVGISTPSMWARAQERLARMKKEDVFADEFVQWTYLNYLALMVAKQEGLVENDSPSTAAIAAMLNHYEVKDVSDEYESDIEKVANPEDPMQSDREGVLVTL